MRANLIFLYSFSLSAGENIMTTVKVLLYEKISTVIMVKVNNPAPISPAVSFLEEKKMGVGVRGWNRTLAEGCAVHARGGAWSVEASK
jgi:hypothetical protein